MSQQNRILSMSASINWPSLSSRGRRIAACAGLVALTLASATAASGVAPVTDWAQTDAGAAHSRANVTESILTPATILSARHRASINVGVDNSHQPCATAGEISLPVESGGFVYAIANGAVVKANATTGAIAWRTVLDPDNPYSYNSLAVSQGLVVAGALDCVSQSDPNGGLRAISATTGAKIWSSGASPVGGALHDMVVSGPYVVSVGTSLGSGTNVGVHLLATGASVWSHTFGAGCGANGTRLAVAGGSVVYNACSFTTGAAFLAADRLSDGVRRWTRAGPWDVLAGDTDASTGRDVYVRNSHAIMTDLVPQTGAIRGVVTGATGLLAVGKSRIFTTCSVGVCSYSRASRALVWSVKVQLARPLAALAGTVLYLDNGTVVRSDTGALLRSLWTGAATSIVVGEGHVVVVKTLRILDVYGL